MTRSMAQSSSASPMMSGGARRTVWVWVSLHRMPSILRRSHTRRAPPRSGCSSMPAHRPRPRMALTAGSRARRRPSRPAGPSPLPGLAPGLEDARAGALLQLAIDRGARVHLDRDEGRDRKSSFESSPRRPMIGAQAHAFALRFT